MKLWLLKTKVFMSRSFPRYLTKQLSAGAWALRLVGVVGALGVLGFFFDFYTVKYSSSASSASWRDQRFFQKHRKIQQFRVFGFLTFAVKIINSFKNTAKYSSFASSASGRVIMFYALPYSYKIKLAPRSHFGALTPRFLDRGLVFKASFLGGTFSPRRKHHFLKSELLASTKRSLLYHSVLKINERIFKNWCVFENWPSRGPVSLIKHRVL